MTNPLLTTKIHIPPTYANLVPRPRLFHILDQGLTLPLTLVSAPAGFGKTTLVRDWLGQVNLPAAWLSLDKDDNDFAQFWTYFIAAVQTIQPEVGTDVLALLQSSPLPSTHALLTLLINDLTTVSEEFIMVLDDYHMTETESIDQALIFLIDHIPPHMHLVIVSRADPNLSLARLRANGQLNELRSMDLRFALVESAQFLTKMTDLSLTNSEVVALDRRIEGWIAGLQMAALSLRKREAADVSRFIEDFSGSHRYIMDYLVDEVLQQQPAEIQTFLLITSILDQLCGPLCEALLKSEVGEMMDESGAPPFDHHPSSFILKYLEHANVFINPLDDQHYWYRYHPLFADLLRHKLQQAYPDRIVDLHLIASQWYEQAGLTDAAVQHALAAQAFSQAAALIEKVALAMMEHGEFARLLTWVDTLPEDKILARPLLALYHGWGLLISGQIRQAEARLKAVEAMLATDEVKQTPEVQGYASAMQAWLARLAGDFASSRALSRQALAYLPEQDSLLRTVITLNLAVAHYFQGEFEPAFQLFTETITAGQTAQSMLNALSAIYHNAQILRAKGALQQALQLCQEELELVTQRGWHKLPATGYLYVAYGELLRERNELSTAREYLEQGNKLAQEGGYILISGYVLLAWLRHIQGDVTGSQEAIRTVLQLLQQHQVSSFWAIPSAASYQARLWIAQGNLAAANRWGQTSGLNQPDSPVTYFHEVENLTLARLLIAQGNLEEAETLLLRMHREAASAERNGSLIEILILQAITLAAKKRSEEALTMLAQALDLAESEGYVRIFLDEGAPMAELLRRAADRGCMLNTPCAC